MASIVLQVAGSALGPLGAMGGAALGGYLDNTYIFPWLFGTPEATEGPRLGELQLQSAAEGSPINFCLGPENRLAGTIIWVSDLIEEIHKEEVGGKGGGPGTNIVVYHYFVDVAVAICEGEINDLKKIWADGKLLFGTDLDTSDSSTLLTATRTLIGTYYPGTNDPYYRYGLIVTSEDSTLDLSTIPPGAVVEMSGWAEGENNANDWVCLSAGKGAAASHCYVYKETDTGQSEAKGANVTITVSGLPEFSGAKSEGITLHTGADDQLADTTIVAHEGAGEVPAFRGTAYVVIEHLALVDYGNRIPQLTFLVEKTATKTVASAMGELVERTGLSGGDYDTSDLSGNMLGFMLGGPQNMASALRHMMKAYNILSRDSAGKLVFVRRSALTQVDVEADDLAAHDFGSDAERPAAISDMVSVDLPQTVNVQFIEKAKDYQQGSQLASRAHTSSQAVHNIQIPLVLTAEEARVVAKRELWSIWMNRRVLRFQLPPSYFWIEENDLLGITVDTETYTVLVKRVSRGHNFLMDVEAVIEGSYTADQTAAVDDPVDPAQSTIFTPPSMLLEVLDVAALSDVENAGPGYYVATCLYSPDLTFSGGAIYSSVDDDVYNLLQEIESETTIGLVATALSDGSVGFWDRENTLDVVLKNGELSSKTELEVLNGLNRALVGQEIVGFQTATLIDTRTYRLSVLLRGLRNTEDKSAGHVNGETFVHLNSPGIIYKDMNLGSVSVNRYFKAGIVGATIADLIVWQRIIEARNIQPFAPCQVTGTRDGSDNLTIQWLRRSRSHTRLFGTNLIPLLEEAEKYEIDIYDNGNVVRTITITAAEEENSPNVDLERSLSTVAAISGYLAHIYTAAQQIVDFGAEQASVHMKLYQMSESVGRGRVEDVTL